MLVSEGKRGDKLSDNSSNKFPFIKLPRSLIDDPNFSGLSAEAKLLFSLILDRMGVSQINADRFTDKNGNLFVYYTIQEICIKLNKQTILEQHYKASKISPKIRLSA